MRTQIILLAIKPVDLSIVGILSCRPVLLHLDHAQMVEAAAHETLHSFLIEALLV